MSISVSYFTESVEEKKQSLVVLGVLVSSSVIDLLSLIINLSCPINWLYNLRNTDGANQLTFAIFEFVSNILYSRGVINIKLPTFIYATISTAVTWFLLV
jgi:hypothetical protein